MQYLLLYNFALVIELASRLLSIKCSRTDLVRCVGNYVVVLLALTDVAEETFNYASLTRNTSSEKL